MLTAPLWPQTLARYPFAEALLPGWRARAAMLPVAYSAALDAALAALDPDRPLLERYQQLSASRERLAELAAAGDDHISTQLLRLRVWTAFGEPEAARQHCLELLEQLEQHKRAAKPEQSQGEDLDQQQPEHCQNSAIAAALRERPFLPSWLQFDDGPVIGSTSDKPDEGKANHEHNEPELTKTRNDDRDLNMDVYLSAMLLETHAHLSAKQRREQPGAELPRLAQRRKLPCVSIESERMLALVALRLGKKVRIKPENRLVTQGRNTNIWLALGQGGDHYQAHAHTRDEEGSAVAAQQGSSKIQRATTRPDVPPPPPPILESAHVLGDPVVTVICLTYNHRDYIEDAIKGVVGQKTNFPFRLIIHDDASTDGTQEIIKEYAAQYPQIIIPIYQKENLFSRGLPFSEITPLKKGKYIASYDGDDYWVDPGKLQIQYDFMESHPDYSCCYHDAFVFSDKGLIKESKLPEHFQKDFSEEELLLNCCFVLPVSWLYRRDCIDDDLKDDEIGLIKNGDNFMLSRLGLCGKGKYLGNIAPAAYRLHGTSLWSIKPISEKQDMHSKTFEGLARYHKRKGNIRVANYYKRKASEDKQHAPVYLTVKSHPKRHQGESQGGSASARFDLQSRDALPKLVCVIASTRHSGGSILSQVLQNAGAAVPFDYLNTAHIPRFAKRWGLVTRQGQVDLRQYLQACMRWRTNDQGIFALKTHWDQFQSFLENNLIMPYLTEARFILIRRQDLLAQAISDEIASHGHTQPVFNAEAIQKKMQSIAQQNMNWSVFLAKTGANWIEVDYEDLMQSTIQTVEKIKSDLIPDFELGNVEVDPVGKELEVKNDATQQQWRQRYLYEQGFWKHY
ncbi:Stf0 family sulfotransferase [Lamprobacter modestohalophilus]|uniref:Stf0 family sulfotransferase n=1 Tax=Lamprobacter modestohalophilus TaxID=1064514 RepID=UPI002ADEA9B3|nr:Stf0 family sulfotransferase [Lamprobacter modestohalophilus]MEA1053150.1 Stf0 family sulfotransferase [Lamprobacter modestohalophilus]